MSSTLELGPGLVVAAEALEPHARSPRSAKSCRATRVCYGMQGRVGDCLVRRCGMNWGELGPPYSALSSM